MKSTKNHVKILIIRFSSFGDIIQCLSLPTNLHQAFDHAEIHWITRKDYADLISNHKGVSKIWALDRKTGIKGLLNMIQELKKENFTHIYDAHNNTRSHLICWCLNGPLGLFGLFKRIQFIRRSQYRLRRFLLFRLGINLYPKPFVGQWALLEPLQKWGVSTQLPTPPQIFIDSKTMNDVKVHLQFDSIQKPLIALSPSASYELKRWPPEYWKSLVDSHPQWRFIFLGGPHDHFIKDIATSSHCINQAGQLSYLASAALIAQCDLIISNDTGLMHVGEQLGLPTIALMGPAPFGYPGRKSTLVLERNLPCRPCSKHGQGPCVNKEFQKCLRDISVKEVSKEIQKILEKKSN